MDAINIDVPEGCQVKGRDGYTTLGRLVIASEATPTVAGGELVALNAMSARELARDLGLAQGVARLLIPPATARQLAGALVNKAREIEGRGLTAQDTDTCIRLVRALVFEWGEHFENDWHGLKRDHAGELVDWIGEKFMPHALNVTWPGGGEPGE